MEKELILLKDFVEKYSKIVTISHMRYLINHAEKNGADAFIHYLGKKILIDEKAFFEWTKKGKKHS